MDVEPKTRPAGRLAGRAPRSRGARRPPPLILALGDLVVDVAAKASEPLAHASDAAGVVVFRQGGSAANTARWVARLGGRAVFIGAVGRDEWARRLRASLEEAGVRVRTVRKPGSTARIVAFVEPGGERTFVTDRGAANLLEPDDLQPAWFAAAAALHVPAYSLLSEPLSSAARRAVVLARAAGAAVSVDLASRRPLLARGRRTAWELIATVAPDLLFANDAEAAALTGPRGDVRLLELASIVVIKEGSAGCRIVARDGSEPARLAVATSPVQAIDTTGAGDAFDAGFLLSWLAAPPETRRDVAVLRWAALAGHRAAGRLLAGARSGRLA
ncbi:MAG: carbohydrate kinase family protein [Candidatus Limnocylindrales bacterium]